MELRDRQRKTDIRRKCKMEDVVKWTKKRTEEQQADQKKTAG